MAGQSEIMSHGELLRCRRRLCPTKIRNGVPITVLPFKVYRGKRENMIVCMSVDQKKSRRRIMTQGIARQMAEVRTDRSVLNDPSESKH